MSPRFAFNGATTGSAADLLTDIRVASEAGFEALEIRETKLAAYLKSGGALYSLRRTLADSGLEVISINALEQSTLVSGEMRTALLRQCRTLCEWASGIGCPYVIAVPSLTDRLLTSSPSTRSTGRTVYNESTVIAETVASLRAMAEVARPFQVKIGFEFLGFAASSVNTLSRARKVIDATKDHNVGLVIDAFHFYVGGSTWESLEGLDPSQLFIVHLDDAEQRPRGALTDAHRLLPGDGIIPLREFIQRLQRIGYAGVYSIELFRPEYWQRDPLELAEAARHKMAALFAV